MSLKAHLPVAAALALSALVGNGKDGMAYNTITSEHRGLRTQLVRRDWGHVDHVWQGAGSGGQWPKGQGWGCAVTRFWSDIEF